MNIIKNAVAVVATLLVLAASLPVALADEGTVTVAKSGAAFKAMTGIKKDGIPPEIFRETQGIALFPGAHKVDFMVSGKSAKGVLLVRDSEGNWSSPVLVTLTGGTLGWQVVGDPMDILLVFKNRQTLEAVLKEKVLLGGNAAPMPGPLGKNLKGAGVAALKAEINSYVLSGGAFADVNVATSTLQVAAANDGFYGAKKVRAEDIVSGKVAKSSPEAARLRELLAEAAGRK